ncbi:response regulator [Pseudobdellovibrio exovorus]|uniref:Two-component response regulator KdpE n=1 Tax=Pseudobdellovibrio exovorus JSS TaxID=1184267 RepID=M4VP23_9BACT|nr:response regulator [Pseudobdellovibrio exovorus]AGH94879.1 two-component response regulator KdpE [Pseudobdellovibrio exovorus JSS]
MKSGSRILIIDDEAAVRNVIKMTLASVGHTIAEASTAAEGLVKANSFHPNLIILDLGLPDMNGLDVLKSFRAWTTIPVVVLTVIDDERTKVTLLDAGADDYLTKPFGPEELSARIRVALRHAGMIEATPVFESGHLKVDLNKKAVLVAGQLVKLTSTEYEVLSRLVRDHGKVVSQVQLLKEIWGTTAKDQGHYLRIYINQLRKKIEPNPAAPIHILTESGVGYRLV